MKFTPFVLLAFGLLAPFIAPGQGLAADAAAGKAMAEGCAGCHGFDGISQEPLTPSLAGQPDEFIQWQLVYFRSGVRKSDVMGPIAEALNNEDIRNLGAYYASLPPPKPAAEQPAAEQPAAGQPAAEPDTLALAGEKLALQHRCKSCHADDFSGFRAAARLAGQREDVLLKALHDFKSGRRIGSGVASMADVVYGLGDDDMQALSHFMARQP